MRRLKLTIGDQVLRAELFDTATADALYAAAPFTSTAQTWGEEVYFETPARVELEPDARDVVEAGELAFWTPGAAIAIGFGPTPASKGDEIRLASPVNIWGKSVENPRCLIDINPGEAIRVERLDTDH